MKQQCPLVLVWLTWLGIPALAAWVGVGSGWWVGLLVLVAGVLAEVAYLRRFPRLSRALGYGSVAHVQAAERPAPLERPTVRLYTASVCPFCPIVRARLAGLSREWGFAVEEIDVTFRPELVLRQGFRSVPVLEAGDARLVGNATSADLAAFLKRAAGRAAGAP